MYDFIDRAELEEARTWKDWTDGPDSEAARAARGEGTRDAKWEHLRARLECAEARWFELAGTKSNPEAESFRRARWDAFGTVLGWMGGLRHRDEKAGCR